MKRVMVFSPKGGVGKSTVVRNLAAAAAVSGCKVATLDTDPQGTLTSWWQKRPNSAPSIEHYQEALSEMTAAPDDLEGIDLLVIDTPTAIETDAYREPAERLIRAADLILVPVQATPEDLESARGALRFIRAQRRPATFVLNRVKPRVREVTDARRGLAGGGDVVPVDLPDLAEVYRSFTAGLGVVEMPRASSAEDFAALWRYVGDKLGIQA